MELIRVEQRPIDGALIQTCNARELHQFLEVGKDFSNWIKAQIKRGRLIEGRDFITDFDTPKRANQNGPGGDRRSVDYHLTLDAGKHIAMMSGTEKGYQVREYFLKCEKLAQTADTAMMQGMAGSVRVIAETTARSIAQELLPEMVKAELSRQHGGYVPGWTAGDVVHEVVEDMKGLKGLPQMVSRRVDQFHKDKGVVVKRAYLGSNKACLFDEATCREWLKKEGRAIIERYVQIRRGQGVFPFVLKKGKKLA